MRPWPEKAEAASVHRPFLLEWLAGAKHPDREESHRGGEPLSFWQGKPVLVTGAGGFIGSHVTEALVRAGARVRAMVHYNSRNNWGQIELLDPDVRRAIEVVCGDIRDPFFCREAVKDQAVVLHLAALIAIPYSYIAPFDYVLTNVVGTLNILQACRDLGVEKVVHTSTSETYGTAQYVPIDEKHPLQGQSPYSASKIGADKIAESFYLSFETPVATLRPFNTFGPRQSARAVIPTIISQLASGGREIRLGSLEPVRDLTFVGDTAAAFLAVAESPATCGEVINAGNGEGISIGDLAKLIIEVMGADATIVRDPHAGIGSPARLGQRIHITKATRVGDTRMSVEWVHEEGTVRITQVAGDKRRIEVAPTDPNAFIGQRCWETRYPMDLVRAVFDVKGPIWLCDEIMRDEDPLYLQFDKTILGYVEEGAFAGRTILDFGCGSGSSTVNLARMFPRSRIIGVELVPSFVGLARSRAAFYGHEHVTFMLSPSGDELPQDIGEVDHIVMSDVYEHLLPSERSSVMGTLWSVLKPGGVLFMTTPNRNFPHESHTTGLPLLNYMPDRLALFWARTFSKRVSANESWEVLLRRGIRGGSIREIKRLLRRSGEHLPIFLEPCRGGVRDWIDLWYEISNLCRPSKLKLPMKWVLKALRRCCRVNLTPSLMLAIRKAERPTP